MAIRSYRDLRVWQIGVDLDIECYHRTAGFPRAEQYGLTSQIRRAGVSISANIAEGHGRAHRADYAYRASVARGSVMEVETEFTIAERLGYVSAPELCDLREYAMPRAACSWSYSAHSGGAADHPR